MKIIRLSNQNYASITYGDFKNAIIEFHKLYHQYKYLESKPISHKREYLNKQIVSRIIELFKDIMDVYRISLENWLRQHNMKEYPKMDMHDFRGSIKDLKQRISEITGAPIESIDQKTIDAVINEEEHIFNHLSPEKWDDVFIAAYDTVYTTKNYRMSLLETLIKSTPQSVDDMSRIVTLSLNVEHNSGNIIDYGIEEMRTSRGAYMDYVRFLNQVGNLKARNWELEIDRFLNKGQ
jgi:hypothetical protein